MLRVIAAITCLLGLGGARAGSEEAVALKADSQAMVDFQGWASGGGIDLKKVALAPELGPGLRGLVAAEDVAAGEPVLDVPFSMLMTLNTAQAGPLSAVLSRKQLSPTVVMALHLLNEKHNASSAFQPWLSVLPTTFETPLSWTEDEMAALNGSTVTSVVRRRKEAMRSDYDSLFGALFADFPALFPREQYTFEAFSWALCTVWSRAFVFNIQSQLVPVIVPYADLLEHGNVGSSFALEDQAKVFRVTLAKPLKKGERVHVSLGAKPNSQLLANYGFVLRDNPYDTVLLSMQLDEKDPFYQAKSNILASANQTPNQLHYLRFDALPPPLLQALRVQLLKPSELDRYTKIFAGKRISLENELDVMRQLVAACDTLLKMYPTTALEDQKLLQDANAFGALSPRAQTALVLVFGEKRVLHRTVELISHAWSLLLVEGWSD